MPFFTFRTVYIWGDLKKKKELFSVITMFHGVPGVGPHISKLLDLRLQECFSWCMSYSNIWGQGL